jgi:hypothetical protein
MRMAAVVAVVLAVVARGAIRVFVILGQSITMAVALALAAVRGVVALVVLRVTYRE